MKKLMLIALLALLADGAFCQSKSKTTDTAHNKPIATSSSFKVNFDYVFKRNFDGTFSPIYPVQVNGEIMGSGVPFNRVTTFGGINVGAYEGHSLMIDTIKGVVLIRKFL